MRGGKNGTLAPVWISQVKYRVEEQGPQPFQEKDERNLALGEGRVSCVPACLLVTSCSCCGCSCLCVCAGTRREAAAARASDSGRDSGREYLSSRVSRASSNRRRVKSSGCLTSCAVSYGLNVTRYYKTNKQRRPAVTTTTATRTQGQTNGLFSTAKHQHTHMRRVQATGIPAGISLPQRQRDLKVCWLVAWRARPGPRPRASPASSRSSCPLWACPIDPTWSWPR